MERRAKVGAPIAHSVTHGGLGLQSEDRGQGGVGFTSVLAGSRAFPGLLAGPPPPHRSPFLVLPSAPALAPLAAANTLLRIKLALAFQGGTWRPRICKSRHL